MKRIWWMLILLFISSVACASAVNQSETNKVKLEWVKILKSEVTVSGECDSTEPYTGHFETRTLSQKEVKKMDGNIDILCDVPSRKDEGLNLSFELVVKHSGGELETLNPTLDPDVWLKVPAGRWCKMNPQTKEINLKNCRKSRP